LRNFRLYKILYKIRFGHRPRLSHSAQQLPTGQASKTDWASALSPAITPPASTVTRCASACSPPALSLARDDDVPSHVVHAGLSSAKTPFRLFLASWPFSSSRLWSRARQRVLMVQATEYCFG